MRWDHREVAGAAVRRAERTPVEVRTARSQAQQHDWSADRQRHADAGQQRGTGDRLTPLACRRSLPGPGHAQVRDAEGAHERGDGQAAGQAQS